LPITDKAISNGVFLTPLTREGTVVLIAVTVVDSLIEQRRYLDAMVKRGTAADCLLKAEFYDQYPTVQDVPKDKRAYLAYLQRANQEMSDWAEHLGRRPVQQCATVEFNPRSKVGG